MQNKRQTSRASYQWWAMDFGCFIWSCCLNLWVWRREELWGHYVCLGLHRVSQVMCLLPGSGWGPETELHPDEPWIWRAATSEMKGRRLGVWWGWGHEGRGSEEIAKEGARHGRMKVTWGKWGRQCNAALISRCIHPIEICDDKWLGYFDVLACIGQILVEQRNNNNCISKTGRPVIFKFYIGRATRFGMASQSYGFSGGWNGWRCWWLSQIVQEDHSGGRDKWQGLYTGQMLPQIIKTFT